MKKIFLILTCIGALFFFAFLYLLIMNHSPANQALYKELTFYTFLLTLVFTLATVAKAFIFRPSGEVEFTNALHETEIKISQLRQVVAVIGQMCFENMQRAMRFGGYSEEEKKDYSQQILTVMQKSGMNQDQIESILDESWHFWVRIDHVFHILGNQILKFTPEQMTEWNRLRSDLKSKTPTPDELERFLKDTNTLSDLRKELLEDYRFYIKYKKHRDFKRWCEIKEKHPPLEFVKGNL